MNFCDICLAFPLWLKALLAFSFGVAAFFLWLAILYVWWVVVTLRRPYGVRHERIPCVVPILLAVVSVVLSLLLGTATAYIVMKAKGY
jgi:hypothetical protein